LRTAIGNYELAMRNFIVTVKTADSSTQYSAVADSSMSAYMHAADQLGDTPCAITVAPDKLIQPTTSPDRAALERARSRLKTSMPLDEMLSVPALAATLRAVATQKPRRKRAPRFDWRKAQANDLD
jgi:type II secretory pathway component PulL